MRRVAVILLCLAVLGIVVVHVGNDVLRYFESDRGSRSIGSPAAGRLEHGKRLPSSGLGFRTYSRLGSLLGRTTVHSAVRATVLDAYADVHDQHAELRFVVGETGWPRGGRIRPHRTHQNGMSVDFMVPVRRSDDVAELPTRPWNKFGYGIEFDESGKVGAMRIDFEAMALHLERLGAAAPAHGLVIERVIFAPELHPELFATAAGRRIRHSLSFTTGPVWIRHDEHYHVDFTFKGTESEA
jgi:penicillin-insensitive murein endopeptidase